MRTTSIEQKQAEYISFLQAKVARLEKENAVLKAALTRQTIEAEKSYRDLQEKFDRISKLVLDVVVNLVKVWKRPCSYDEIIRAFQARHPRLAKAETISRRVRELVTKGYLTSPERGKFVPVPKGERK